MGGGFCCFLKKKKTVKVQGWGQGLLSEDHQPRKRPKERLALGPTLLPNRVATQGASRRSSPGLPFIIHAGLRDSRRVFRCSAGAFSPSGPPKKHAPWAQRHLGLGRGAARHPGAPPGIWRRPRSPRARSWHRKVLVWGCRPVRSEYLGRGGSAACHGRLPKSAGGGVGPGREVGHTWAVGGERPREGKRREEKGRRRGRRAARDRRSPERAARAHGAPNARTHERTNARPGSPLLPPPLLPPSQ